MPSSLAFISLSRNTRCIPKPCPLFSETVKRRSDKNILPFRGRMDKSKRSGTCSVQGQSWRAPEGATRAARGGVESCWVSRAVESVRVSWCRRLGHAGQRREQHLYRSVASARDPSGRKRMKQAWDALVRGSAVHPAAISAASLGAPGGHGLALCIPPFVGERVVFMHRVWRIVL